MKFCIFIKKKFANKRRISFIQKSIGLNYNFALLYTFFNIYKYLYVNQFLVILTNIMFQIN